jgi:hypothetical protein
MDWSFKMQHDSCEAAASFDHLVHLHPQLHSDILVDRGWPPPFRAPTTQRLKRAKNDKQPSREV